MIEKVLLQRRIRLYFYRMGCLTGIILLALLSEKTFPAGLVTFLFQESLLLMFSCWILFVTYHQFKKNCVRISVFVILFLWGCLVYRGDGDILRAANFVSSAFFPSRGGYNDNSLNPSEYFLFHFAVYLYFGGIVFSFFGRGLINRGRLFLIRNRDLNVFWGASPQALALAQDILNHSATEQNLFLLSSGVPDGNFSDINIVDRLDSSGMLWIVIDSAYSVSKKNGAKRHFFLDDDGAVNMRRAKSFLDQLGNTRKKNIFLSLYIRIEDSVDDSFLTDWLEQVKAIAEIHIIRESSLNARILAIQHPMLNCPGIHVDANTKIVSGEFSLLLLGLGCQGKELLNAMVCNAQFKGASFHVDIVDKNANAFQYYFRQCPEAIERYNLAFHSMDVNGGEFNDWIVQSLAKYNRIIICFGSDELNIELADRLKRIIHEEMLPLNPDLIFARVRKPETYEFCAEGKCLFNVFGNLQSIYTYDMLIAEKLDYSAKLLNGIWAGENADIEDVWRKGSFFNQESSRAAALGQLALLHLLGFEVISSPSASQAWDELNEILKRHSLILAENEHLRWNAFHLLHGIHPWDLKNPSLDSVPKKKANQIGFCNRHAALVDFDRLPDVDFAIARAVYPTALLSVEMFQEFREIVIKEGVAPIIPLQRHDIQFVQNIPKILQTIGASVIHRTRDAQTAEK